MVIYCLIPMNVLILLNVLIFFPYFLQLCGYDTDAVGTILFVSDHVSCAMLTEEQLFLTAWPNGTDSRNLLFPLSLFNWSWLSHLAFGWLCFSLYEIAKKKIDLCGWKHPYKYRDVMSEYMILISLLPLSTYLQLKEMEKDWWSMKAEST